MSSIKKIAVYDARLLQDEPAYAVQKGALSVSVAPFSAISASSAQMTFQVLVPSLNVFVDRKLQISAGLNFTANLFYGGPRSTSLMGMNNFIGVSTAALVGTTLTLGAAPTINGVAGATLPIGTLVWSQTSTTILPPQTYITYAASSTSYQVNVSANVAAITALCWQAPMTYDVPDPVAGVQFGLTFDSGFSGANQDDAFQAVGFATAVGPKDLAYTQFPLQTALTNMTATLNDCTVTTNGDTLREQLMLTSCQENLKQRTTPTSPDSFSWGRDDSNSGSGNFSSYSVVNGYGDVPNGAFPTTWFADASQSIPLSSASKVIATGTNSVASGTSASYPFVAAGAYSFNLGGSGTTNIQTGASGCGFYVAPTNASNVSGFTASSVIVPFVNNQPVWTTGFPGGDLFCVGNTSMNSVTGTNAGYYGGNAGFVLSSGVGASFQVLTLTKSVPPYCMIGARLYITKNSAIFGTSVGSSLVPVVGFVCNLLTGSLGAAGSTYNVCTGTSIIADNQLTLLSLTAGYTVTNPMPVFGQVAVVEPLVVSPLIWADSAEFQTVGLYGMTNMQFVLNFAPLGTCYAASNPAAASLGSQQLASLPYWVDDLTRPTQNTGNILRSSNLRSIISDLAFGTPANLTGPWTSPTVFAAFLTPGPDVSLPLVSTVPYVEFPRYVQTLTGSTFAGSQQVRTQTISLTSIPDMVMIYVKPATKGPSQLDQYIPISNVSVTFDNFSNLCSGFQQFNLYESAVASGLDIDWHQWRGFSQSALSSVARQTASSTAVTTSALYKQTGVTQLSGGPILLRMGHDITLSPGLAPGCLGNYSFQATVTTSNPFGFYDYLTSVTITVIAINTGFFETVRGQSAIRKTILNSADVESATPETGTTKTHLARMVGRGAYMRGGSSHVMGALANNRHARRLIESGAAMSNAAAGSYKRGRASGIE